jgi:hypothetical protein
MWHHSNKGNRSIKFTDYMTKSIGELIENNIIQVPIVNNASNHDDGGDFRIDIWINNYDNRFLKANYPAKHNSTYEVVDITPLVEYVIDDINREREKAYDP